MIKILSVTAQKPNSTGSGIYLSETVKELDKLGYEQAVLAGIYEEDIVNLPAKVGFYPIYFHSHKLPFSIVGMSDEMPYKSTLYGEMTEDMGQLFETAFIEQLDKAVLEFQPHIILCHHLYYLTAIVRDRYKTLKVMGFCHGTDIRQLKKIPLKREWIKEQIGKLDYVFALQDTQKKEIEILYNVPSNFISVLGGGYNHRVFYEQQRQARNKVIRIIFAGKIAEKKGVKSLLRAMEYMPYEKKDLVLSMAGGYGNKKEYEEIVHMAESCKYKVEWLGLLSQEELGDMFRECEVFVLPSFYEGLALVLLEALACGMKVVASDLEGIRPWFDQNIWNHGIRFVKPPAMLNIDEATTESLEAFEKRLAEGLISAIENEKVERLSLETLSWEGLSKKMANIIRRFTDVD